MINLFCLLFVAIIIKLYIKEYNDLSLCKNDLKINKIIILNKMN